MSEPTSNHEVLQWVKISPDGFAPVRSTIGAAGCDLRAARPVMIEPLSKAIVDTDIQIKLPEGTYGRIAPRSGLARDFSIDVGAGVIDSDFTGAVKIILFNFGKESFEVKSGDRVAQLICERISRPQIEECQALPNTIRGSHGFGSTGRN